MNKKLYKLMNWPKIEAIAYADESNPLEILGTKIVGNSTLFQTFFPNAKEAYILLNDKSIKMEMADELGFFVALVPEKNIKDYSYEYILEDSKIKLKDAYAYKGYEIKNDILAKYSAGISYDIYNYLGAKEIVVNNNKGTYFSLWAPNALSVSVVGDFNNNTPNVHIMNKNEEFGVFEIFIPDVTEGAKYKFSIKTKNGSVLLKSDPYARKLDTKEGWSIVYTSKYTFKNKNYKLNQNKDIMSILEIDLSLYKNKDDKLIEDILKKVQDLGYTYIELMPIMEYASKESKGYQTSAFYAISERYQDADFIKELIDTMHINNIGVIIDWAPNHFPISDYGMNNLDGTCLYEHMDPRKGIHPFLGTALFNYGRNEVSIYLIANALYYLKEFKADGLKIDSLSNMLYLDYGRNDGEWIPNIYGGNENLEAIEFIKHLNSIVKKECKDALMIAMDDSGYPNMTEALADGGLGFDYKFNYNMMMDYIDYIKNDPYDRSKHHDQLTLSYLYQYKERFINALSNNLIKDNLIEAIPGNDIDKLNTIKLSIAYMMAHPGKKLINYEFLNEIHNKGLNSMIKAINKMFVNYPALNKLDESSDGFEWINCIDYNKCILSFIRKDKNIDNSIYIVANFANIEQKLLVGTNQAGKYKEIFNTDDKDFGGLGKTNKKNIPVSEFCADGREFSFEVKLSPLSLCIFKYIPFTEKEQFEIDKKKEAAIANTKANEYKKQALEQEILVKQALEDMNAAKERMQAAQKEADNFYKLEKQELNKAKKALDACK